MTKLYCFALLVLIGGLGQMNAYGQCNFGTIMTGSRGSATYIGTGSHNNVLCPGDSVFNLATTGSNQGYLDSGAYYFLNGSGGNNTFYVKNHATLDLSGNTGTGNIIRYDPGATIITAPGSTGNTMISCAGLTFNAAPAISSISGISTVCVGSTIRLTDATTGGAWSRSNENASVDSTGTVTGISAGVDTISYTVTNNCGTAIVTRVITVQPVSPALTGLDTVCAGCAITLTVNTTGGSWSSSNATVATVTGGIVTGVNAGTDTIRYTGNNSCGPYSAIMVITVTSQPDAGVISGAGTVCTGSYIQLTDPIGGGVWKNSNNSAIVSGGLVAGVTPGTDTISYIVSNTHGADTATFIITVLQTPTVSPITGANTICTGCTTTLTDATSGGTWSSTNANATVSGGVVTGVTAGRDTIRYTISNACSNVSATFMINVTATVNAGTISGSDQVCVGSTITLTDSAAGPPAGINRTWSANNGTVSVNPVGPPSYSCIITGLSSGSVTIAFTVITPNGSGTATKRITVNALPQPIILPLNGVLITSTTYTNYQWNYNGAAIPGADSSRYQITISGNYSVTVTDTNGCSGTSTSVFVSIPGGVSTVNSSTNIRVYPNPAQSVVYILSPGRVTAQLTSIEGRVLMIQNNATKMDVRSLATGTYLLELFDAESGLKVKTERVVVNR